MARVPRRVKSSKSTGGRKGDLLLEELVAANRSLRGHNSTLEQNNRALNTATEQAREESENERRELKRQIQALMDDNKQLVLSNEKLARNLAKTCKELHGSEHTIDVLLLRIQSLDHQLATSEHDASHWREKYEEVRQRLVEAETLPLGGAR